MVSSFIALPDLTLKVKDPGFLLQKEAKNIPADAIIITDASTVTAACWYLKRNDLYLTLGGGELEYGLARPEGQHRILKNYEAIQQIIDTKQGKDVVFLFPTKHWKRYFQDFPEPRAYASSGQYGHVVVTY